jgi:hypothetical protein
VELLLVLRVDPALKEIPANTIIWYAELVELALFVDLKAIPVVTGGDVVRIISVNQMDFVRLVDGMILHVVKVMHVSMDTFAAPKMNAFFVALLTSLAAMEGFVMKEEFVARATFVSFADMRMILAVLGIHAARGMYVPPRDCAIIVES